MTLSVPLLFFMAGPLVMAQAAPAIVGAGYQSPVPLRVTAGQVVTVFVAGSGSAASQETTATTVPLPFTLAGFSLNATLTSGTALSSPSVIPFPILSVKPLTSCMAGGGVTPCTPMVGITVQVPFEVTNEDPYSTVPGHNYFNLTVTENGTLSFSTGLDPLWARPHFVNTCDSTLGQRLWPYAGCQPAVTHADGSLLSQASPAVSGEVVTAYLQGLGRLRTSDDMKTGTTFPAAPSAVRYTPFLTFSFRLGSGTGDTVSRGSDGSYPLYAGSAPNTIGLYQVNFRIPNVPAGVSSCGISPFGNLQVTLDQILVTDTADICVQASP